MISSNDLRNGMSIELDNGVWMVVEFLHVKPGKGGAFVKVKVRNLESGRILENTYNAGEKIDIISIERRPYQFLYKEEGGYNFMHAETFEQVLIEESIINAPQFLKEGQNVEITFHADTETPLQCELPAFVEMLITYTEPGEKGNTATNAMKEATVETGATVRVPLFINDGERIKVDTRTGDYSERVK